MDQRTREYELLYIISASFTDDEMGAIEGRIKALLEKNGASIISTNRLGKFRLTYPIKKQRHGHYVMLRLNADTQAVSKMEEALRITPEVLRDIFVRADEVGSDKFDLVQFTEVNIDLKAEQRDRRGKEVRPDEKSKAIADIKSGVAALEGEDKGEDKPAETKPDLSDEELTKKIDSALADKI
ncbi:MAG: 30S ribosomal protein S6 [Patescibacteria group bacterium]